MGNETERNQQNPGQRQQNNPGNATDATKKDPIRAVRMFTIRRIRRGRIPARTAAPGNAGIVRDPKTSRSVALHNQGTQKHKTQNNKWRRGATADCRGFFLSAMPFIFRHAILFISSVPVA